MGGKHRLITPIIIPLEVTAAIRRQSRDQKLANAIYELILSLPNNELIELNFLAAQLVTDTIQTTSLKVNDAFILTVCKESQSTLATLDRELISCAIPDVNMLKLYLSMSCFSFGSI